MLLIGGSKRRFQLPRAAEMFHIPVWGPRGSTTPPIKEESFALLLILWEAEVPHRVQVLAYSNQKFVSVELQ